jgi:hypothetical protein
MQKAVKLHLPELQHTLVEYQFFLHLNGLINLPMRLACFTAFILFFLYSCSSEEKFENISLTNRVETIVPELNVSGFGNAFLLQYNNETFAITAKHFLRMIKMPQVDGLSFDALIKNWVMFPLDKEEDTIVMSKLLNRDADSLLGKQSPYENDWLIFSIQSNNSSVKPLQVRTTPLKPGENVYIIGYTKEDGRNPGVYKFEYYKTIEQRILLKGLTVAEGMVALGGAPVIDEQGAVVAIASADQTDPETGKQYYAPCLLNELIAFLQKNQTKTL